MSLQNVGDVVGSNRQHIGNLEHSRVSPSLAMAIALAELFDVSLDYLVGRTNDPSGTKAGGGDEETAASEWTQNPERERLIGLIKTLCEDDAGKVKSFAAFLRCERRREEKKKRNAEGKDVTPS